MDQEHILKAKAKVQERRGFYIHLGIYGIIITGFFLVNWITLQENNWWALWIALGWGIGLTVDTFIIFTLGKLFDANWVNSKAEQIARKESDQAEDKDSNH
jgi:hypothetical protein